MHPSTFNYRDEMSEELAILATPGTHIHTHTLTEENKNGSCLSQMKQLGLSPCAEHDAPGCGPNAIVSGHPQCNLIKWHRDCVKIYTMCVATIEPFTLAFCPGWARDGELIYTWPSWDGCEPRSAALEYGFWRLAFHCTPLNTQHRAMVWKWK